MTRLVFRKLEEAGVAPLGKLVKAADYQVIAEADRALAQLETQGKRAYAAAVEQGRKDGQAEGEKTGAALMADTAIAAQDYWHRSEQRLAALVMEAVRRIVGEFDGAEQTARLVRQLVGEVVDEGKIRLHVSPAQFRHIQDCVRRMPPHSPAQTPGGIAGSEAMEVIADASIEDGACRMETALGFVETSIEAQLQVLSAALEKHLAEHR